MKLSDYFLPGVDIRELPGRQQDTVLTWTFQQYVHEVGVFPERFVRDSVQTIQYIRIDERIEGRLILSNAGSTLSRDTWQKAYAAYKKVRTGITFDLESLKDHSGIQSIRFRWDIRGRKPPIWSRSQWEFICAQASRPSPDFRITIREEGAEFAALNASDFAEKLRQFPIPSSRWIYHGPLRQMARWEDINRLGDINRRSS